MAWFHSKSSSNFDTCSTDMYAYKQKATKKTETNMYIDSNFTKILARILNLRSSKGYFRSQEKLL